MRKCSFDETIPAQTKYGTFRAIVIFVSLDMSTKPTEQWILQILWNECILTVSKAFEVSQSTVVVAVNRVNIYDEEEMVTWCVCRG